MFILQSHEILYYYYRYRIPPAGRMGKKQQSWVIESRVIKSL